MAKIEVSEVVLFPTKTDNIPDLLAFVAVEINDCIHIAGIRLIKTVKSQKVDFPPPLWQSEEGSRKMCSILDVTLSQSAKNTDAIVINVLRLFLQMFLQASFKYSFISVSFMVLSADLFHVLL